MSKELDAIAKEFSKESPIVKRTDLCLYQSSMSTASASFLREVEQTCKKLKQANLTLIMVCKTDQ